MPTRLIDCYKAIEDGSRRMLQAAHAGDWRGVADIENDCKVLIQQLKSCARQSSLPEEMEARLTRAEQGEKQRILRRILGVDAQIRGLTEPWPLGEGAQFAAGAGRPQLLH